MGLRLTGTWSDSGDGINPSFTIPHGLPKQPHFFSVTPCTGATVQDASGASNTFWVSPSATDLIVTYTAPPPAPPGVTPNLEWVWQAECN